MHFFYLLSQSVEPRSWFATETHQPDLEEAEVHHDNCGTCRDQHLIWWHQKFGEYHLAGLHTCGGKREKESINQIYNNKRKMFLIEFDSWFIISSNRDVSKNKLFLNKASWTNWKRMSYSDNHHIISVL